MAYVRDTSVAASKSEGEIFTRIARGEQVELHYPDGTIIRVGAAHG